LAESWTFPAVFRNDRNAAAINGHSAGEIVADELHDPEGEPPQERRWWLIHELQ